MQMGQVETGRYAATQAVHTSMRTRCVVGVLLAALWYAVLLVPELTRNALLGEPDRSAVRMGLTLVVASMLLTATMWSFATRGRVWRVLGLGMALTLGLAFCYSALVWLVDAFIVVPSLLQELNEHPEGPGVGLIGAIFGLAATFVVGVPISAAVAIHSSYFLTLPMGALHVLVMRSIGIRQRPQSVEQAVAGSGAG